MKRLMVLLCVVGATVVSRSAEAAPSCWEVTGWSSAAYVGAEAIVTPTDCTTVPFTHGWAPITLSYGTPPTDPLWLRISFSDSRVSGTTFAPLLVFSHYSGTTPVVKTDLIPCIGCPNTTPLGHIPPSQGAPLPGSLVRLRHLNSGKCVSTSPTSGQAASSSTCSNVAGFTFALDAAGGGLYRLRNTSTNQCLYTTSTSGAAVYHWGCWPDPAMRFSLVSASGHYRLQNYNAGQCLYSNGSGVFSWVCWPDANMVYAVDVIQY